MLEYFDLMLNDKDYFIENLPGILLLFIIILGAIFMARCLWVDINGGE